LSQTNFYKPHIERYEVFLWKLIKKISRIVVHF
jgi:hypothetical protein